MHHIALGTLARVARAAVPLRPVARGNRRAAYGVYGPAFTELVSCQLLEATAIEVENAAAGFLQLVRLGFLVSVPPKVRIEWIRFAVRFTAGPGSSAGGETQQPALATMYPSRIVTPLAAVGRVSVSPEGELNCEEHPADEPTRRGYTPRLLGYALEARVVWDWLPAGGEAPAGSDQMLASVWSPPGGLDWTGSLKLSLRHVTDGEAQLAYRSEPAPVTLSP